jgi:ketosteroid isomerase-like protein
VNELAALAARVQMLEDQLAVAQVVLGYGPAVDSGAADAVAALFTEDGRYEYQADVPALEGRAAVRAMVDSGPHQGLLASGCAHVLTAPHVVVDGDTAVATCYSLLHQRRTDGYAVTRVSSNRWELQRTAEGWQVTSRTNRLLDGSAPARALLRPP